MTKQAKGDMKLEVGVIPVSDVDRAKQFYVGLGWRLDGDSTSARATESFTLTPPGSQASVMFGRGVTPSRRGPPRHIASPSTTSTPRAHSSPREASSERRLLQGQLLRKRAARSRRRP